MAFELAVYEDRKRIVAHTLTCPTVGSVGRTYQSGPMIRVTPEWTVFRCDHCLPKVIVVEVTSASIHGRGYFEKGWQGTRGEPENPRGPNTPTSYSARHSMRKWERVIHRTNPDSSFPPYGVVALDITHSENREKWWKEAECNSDDERLGPWLRDLFTTDHNEHWSLTIQKVVCSQCPVRAECLEQGVWGYESWGVWGGATIHERRELRKKWIREGRVDERPDRPKGYGGQGHSGNVRGTDGGWASTTRGYDEFGDESGESDDETTSESMPEVRPEREVRWPRTYGRSTGYKGEGISGW